MKCILPGSNIKVFGRAIHSLSKIGEELYIEALEHGLALRTVNSSRSAYACFIFAPSFFLHYSDEVVDDASSTSDDEILKYKINMKSCLTVFKSLSTLEKSVDKCKIQLDLKESRLVFQMYCKHGIVKTHNLAFIECETLQAVFSKDSCLNILTAQTKLLCEAVLNFQVAQEEVTLIIDSSKMRLKNYVEDEADPQKVVRTELSLDPEEFISYIVGLPGEVTFCLKELRAILAFSETSNLSVSIHFDSASKPIVFTMDTDPSFEANFVLATLADKNSSVGSEVQSQQQSSQQVSHSTAKSLPANRAVHRKPTQRKEERRKKPDLEASRHVGNGDGHSSVTDPQRNQNDNTVSMSTQPNTSSQLKTDRQECRDDDVMDTSDVTAGGDATKCATIQQIEGASTRDVTSRICVTGPDSDVTMESPERARASTSRFIGDGNDDDDALCSPVIPVQTMSSLIVPSVSNWQSFQNGNLTDEDTDNKPVPGSPPSKKFKSIFSNLSQSPPRQPQDYQVLVPDTDDED